MNELLVDIIFGTIIVIIVAYMISRIDYKKDDRMPKIVMYGYDECKKCGKVRIHKMLLHREEVLQADCMACSVGELRYNVLEGVLTKHRELEEKRFEEMIESWTEEEEE